MAVKKQPFTIERLFRASPTILYSFLTTPSNLVQWFADFVDLNGDVYTFSWSGDEQEAEILVDIEDELLRLRWLDDEDDKAYLEFKIKNRRSQKKPSCTSLILPKRARSMTPVNYGTAS